MSAPAYDDLTQIILSLDLLDLGKLRDLENSFGARIFTSEEFLQEALRRGYLTKFQVERLSKGETTGYSYGPYIVQYLIGAGSFARVFRCIHKDTGQVVAVKVLRARFRDDKTAINEFLGQIARWQERLDGGLAGGAADDSASQNAGTFNFIQI